MSSLLFCLCYEVSWLQVSVSASSVPVFCLCDGHFYFFFSNSFHMEEKVALTASVLIQGFTTF